MNTARNEQQYLAQVHTIGLEYNGRWIAYHDGKVVWVANSCAETVRAASEKGYHDAYITKVLKNNFNKEIKLRLRCLNPILGMHIGIIISAQVCCLQLQRKSRILRGLLTLPGRLVSNQNLKAIACIGATVKLATMCFRAMCPSDARGPNYLGSAPGASYDPTVGITYLFSSFCFPIGASMLAAFPAKGLMGVYLPQWYVAATAMFIADWVKEGIFALTKLPRVEVPYGYTDFNYCNVW